MLTCDHVRCGGCNRPIPGVVDRCMYCGEDASPSADVEISPWVLPGEEADDEEVWLADLASLARVLCAAGEQSIAAWGNGAPPTLVERLQADLERLQSALDSGDEDALADALEALEHGWSRLTE